MEGWTGLARCFLIDFGWDGASELALALALDLEAGLWFELEASSEGRSGLGTLSEDAWEDMCVCGLGSGGLVLGRNRTGRFDETFYGDGYKCCSHLVPIGWPHQENK